MPKNSMDPVDRHVGLRVRMRRLTLGLSQEQLALRLGLSFQQVQKYEKGTNRIGASRMQHIAQILQVPPSFFFEGLPHNIADKFPHAPSPSDVSEFATSEDGLALSAAFNRIPSARVRRGIVNLVKDLSELNF